MRSLTRGEIYQKTFRGDNELDVAINNQLSADNGVIVPKHIESVLVDLRNRSKKLSSCAFLADSLALYEKRGLIRLFNLSNLNAGRSKVPTMLPYFPGKARARYKEGDLYNTNNAGKDNVIFVNMYRIGNWSADESEYLGLNAITDLATCLESGYIGYKIVWQGMGEKVFSDPKVLANLIKLYAYLFSKAVIKTKTGFGPEFNVDAANFLIARFFLLYVLEKPDNSSVDDYARLAIKNGSSMESLKTFEELSGIDYSSLSAFLKTFGEAFYNGEGIELVDFENKWLSLYGDATGLAIEYVPYLLHFLLAAQHGAYLGGSTRLSSGDNKNNLIKAGLPNLYRAVSNVLK